MKRSWTVMVVPHSSGKVHNLTIKSWHVRLLFHLVFWPVVAFGVLWLYNYNTRLNIKKLTYARDALEKSLDNMDTANVAHRKHTLVLEQKLTIQDAELQELRAKVYNVAKLEKWLRDVAGLEAEDGSDPPAQGAFLESQGGEDYLLSFRKALEEAESTFSSLSDLAQKMQNQEERWVHTPTVWPVTATNAKITSNYGNRKNPKTGKVENHKGLDIRGVRGTNVQTTASGKVTYARWDGPYGRKVVIEHGGGYKTVYGHLDKILVEQGQAVTKGDYIGLLGSSGNSTGPHVHYEVWYLKKPVDPKKYLIE